LSGGIAYDEPRTSMRKSFPVSFDRSCAPPSSPTATYSMLSGPNASMPPLWTVSSRGISSSCTRLPGSAWLGFPLCARNRSSFMHLNVSPQLRPGAM
jgi:hypothetical protein